MAKARLHIEWSPRREDQKPRARHVVRNAQRDSVRQNQRLPVRPTHAIPHVPEHHRVHAYSNPDTPVVIWNEDNLHRLHWWVSLEKHIESHTLREATAGAVAIEDIQASKGAARPQRRCVMLSNRDWDATVTRLITVLSTNVHRRPPANADSLYYADSSFHRNLETTIEDCIHKIGKS
jgi:hypothetical protein